MKIKETVCTFLLRRDLCVSSRDWLRKSDDDVHFCLLVSNHGQGTTHEERTLSRTTSFLNCCHVNANSKHKSKSVTQSNALLRNLY